MLDGLFLHRDELAGYWDFSVFLHRPLRGHRRPDGRSGTARIRIPAIPNMARYVQGQRLYFAACRPWERADLVIDNSDVARPAVVTPQAADAP